MKKFIKRLFEPSMSTREIQPVIAALNAQRRAMEAKDPILYAAIKNHPIREGRDMWREHYPNDLASQYVVESKVNP